MKKISIAVGGATLMLAACSGDPVRDADPAPPVSADVSEALLPPMSVVLPSRVDPADRRFDVETGDLDARTFFLSLVEGTPFSVVVNPRVKGTVSVSMKNATVPEIMDTVRDDFGYEMRRSGLRYTVLPAELQTRTFQVDYLNLTRKGKSKTRITSGQITDTVGGNQQGAGGQQANAGGQAGGANANQAATTGSNIETESESDFWAGFERSLKIVVGEGEGQRVSINPDAGLVVVRALPATMREVAEFIKVMHSNLHRQVVLETKILEVSLRTGYQTGINWSSLTVNGNKTLFAGQIGGQNSIGSGTSTSAGSAITVTPGQVTTGFNSTAIGGALTLALDFPDFNTVIELLKSQGDVQVLSSPRISTVNNQKAIIKVGSDEFFVTGVTSNTANNNNGTTNSSSIQIQPFFSGIALDVTPRIYGDGQVILHVHPTVSEVREQPKLLVVDGQNQQLPLAFSSLRETDSIVRARSGQIVVIGGLMQDRVTDERFSVPLLGDIPLLGYLFSQTRQVNSKSELVVLMKPIVMDEDDEWQQQMRGTRQRLDRINPEFSRRDSWVN